MAFPGKGSTRGEDNDLQFKMDTFRVNAQMTMLDLERQCQARKTTRNRLKNELDNFERQESSHLINIRKETRSLRKELDLLQRNTGRTKHPLGMDNSFEHRKGKYMKKYQQRERLQRLIANSNTSQGATEDKPPPIANEGADDKTQTEGRNNADEEKPTKTARSSFRRKKSTNYRGGLMSTASNSNRSEAQQSNKTESSNQFGTGAVDALANERRTTEGQNAKQGNSKSDLMDTKETEEVTMRNSNNSRNDNSKCYGTKNTWYTNMDDARAMVSRRLGNDGKSVGGSESPDLTPFLHAPPDGLPRTMYLLPDSDLTFNEARKARYLRHPGTRLDPIDRELNVKEIFDAGGDEPREA